MQQATKPLETSEDLPEMGTAAQQRQLFESGGLVHEGRKLIEDEDVSWKTR